jgi:hypothetical protein
MISYKNHIARNSSSIKGKKLSLFLMKWKLNVSYKNHIARNTSSMKGKKLSLLNEMETLKKLQSSFQKKL